jgi:hypothetical protein
MNRSQNGSHGRISDFNIAASGGTLNVVVRLFSSEGRDIDHFAGTISSGSSRSLTELKGSALSSSGGTTDDFRWGEIDVYSSTATATFTVNYGSAPHVHSLARPVGPSSSSPLTYLIGRYPND